MDIQKHIPDYSSLTSELEKNIRRKKAAAGAGDLAGFISVLYEACPPQTRTAHARATKRSLEHFLAAKPLPMGWCWE